MEAIAALGPRASGSVVWDLDWERADASRGRIRKLSITDTGIGMSPDAMRYYINHLAATSHEQGRTKNHGVGAKVAARPRNPHGLEIAPGIRAVERSCASNATQWTVGTRAAAPDGRRDFWRPLMDSEKPWAARARPHGTQVVLLGQHERDDTTQAPKTVTEGQQCRVARYLNNRFRRLPDQLELLVRSHQRNVRRDGGELERILGQKPQPQGDRDDHRTPGQPNVTNQRPRTTLTPHAP